MSMFSNLFGGTSGAATQPTQNTGAPVAQPAQTTQQVAQPVIPATPVDESPLAEFSTLWEPAPADTNAPIEPGSLYASVDPAKMLAAAKKVNFAQSIPQEVLAKITAGGADAGPALMQVLNEVSQRSYAQATLAASKMIDTAIKQSQDVSNDRLPSLIKKHAVSDSIRQANPALQHPGAAPILQALETQFTAKYPTATVDEIKTLASNYLVQFSKAANPAPVAKVNPAEDWSAFEAGLS
jgi:hypothetical protein